MGGEDFDNKLIDHVLSEFEDETGMSLRGDKVAMQRVKEGVEKAKHELSSALETDVSLPFIANGPSGPVHLDVSIERDELEDLVGELIERLAIPCNACMDDAKVSKGRIRCCPTGRWYDANAPSSVQSRRNFGKPPETGINPDEVVAIGAAVQASVLMGETKRCSSC